MRAGPGLHEPGSKGVPEGVKTQRLKLELEAGPLHPVLDRRLRNREEGLGETVLRDLHQNCPGTYRERNVRLPCLRRRKLW